MFVINTPVTVLFQQPMKNLLYVDWINISDLIDDWSTKSVPDVIHFVPYTYNINILINKFELVTLCNEYNWIDTSSSQKIENGLFFAYNSVYSYRSNYNVCYKLIFKFTNFTSYILIYNW